MHTIKRTSTCQMPKMGAAIDAEQRNQSPHTLHTARVFGQMSQTKCALENLKKLYAIHYVEIPIKNQLKKYLQVFDKFMSML